MKKGLLLTLCLSVVAFSSSAQAIELKNMAAGALKTTASTVKTTATNADTTTIRKSISTMNEKLALANKDVQSAFTSLVTAISSKEEAAEIRAQIKAINDNKNLSDVEKSSHLATIMSDYGNNLQNANEELKTKLKSASSEKTNQILTAIDSLMGATIKYTDLTNDVQSIINQLVSNPTLATSMRGDFTEIKNTGKMLKTNLKSLKDVTTSAVNLCKTCGIKVQKTATKSSKTQKVDFSKLSK